MFKCNTRKHLLTVKTSKCDQISVVCFFSNTILSANELSKPLIQSALVRQFYRLTFGLKHWWIIYCMLCIIHWIRRFCMFNLTKNAALWKSCIFRALFRALLAKPGRWLTYEDDVNPRVKLPSVLCSLHQETILCRWTMDCNLASERC